MIRITISDPRHRWKPSQSGIFTEAHLCAHCGMLRVALVGPKGGRQADYYRDGAFIVRAGRRNPPPCPGRS